MDIVDIWVNLVTPESAASFLGQAENANIPGYLGGDGSAGVGIEQLLGVMDANDVATGVLTPAIGSGLSKSLEIAAAHEGRFLVAGVVHDPSTPSKNVRRIRDARTGSSLQPRARDAALDAGRHRRPEALPRLPSVRRAAGSRSRSTSGSPGHAFVRACNIPSCSKTCSSTSPTSSSSARTWAIPTRSCS